MLKTKMYYGPAGKQEAAKSVLQALGVPGHLASVYEQNHDTGYPGLEINYTIIELVFDEDNEYLYKRAVMVLKNLGFSER